jgi:hypothetical protein
VRGYAEKKDEELTELLAENVARPRCWGTIKHELSTFEFKRADGEHEDLMQMVYRPYLQALLDNIERRFPPQPVLEALSRMLAEQPLPRFAEDREAELKIVFNHYQSLLPEQSADAQRLLRREYEHFLTWAESYQKKHASDQQAKLPALREMLAPTALLQLYMEQCGTDSPNLLLLIQLLLVLPVSSAEAERAFSCMNRIHDDERASLGQDTVDDLMMISLNGPPLKDFDFHTAVMTWYCKGDRREKLSKVLVAAWKATKASNA